MVDLCELMYFSYYGVDYNAGEEVECSGLGYQTKIIPDKTEDEDVHVER